MPAWRLFNGGSRLSPGRKWEPESRVAASWWIVSGDKKLSHGEKWCNWDAWNHIHRREKCSFYFFVFCIFPGSATNLLSGDWKRWCHFLANSPFRQINSPPTWRSTTLCGREVDAAEAPMLNLLASRWKERAVGQTPVTTTKNKFPPTFGRGGGVLFIFMTCRILKALPRKTKKHRLVLFYKLLLLQRQPWKQHILELSSSDKPDFQVEISDIQQFFHFLEKKLSSSLQINRSGRLSASCKQWCESDLWCFVFCFFVCGCWWCCTWTQ